MVQVAAHCRRLMISARESDRRLVLLGYLENPALSNRVVATQLGIYGYLKHSPRFLSLAILSFARRLGVRSALEVRLSYAMEDDFWSHTQVFHPHFDYRERVEIRKAFQTLGLAGDKKMIAILTRDQSYFQTFTSNQNWIRRHDYRNCKIVNYQPAIDYAWSRGYQSVRVGRMSDNILTYQSPGFIDYSVSTERSDLMDLALAARSDMILTCSSGLDTLYHLVGKPLIGINLPYLDGRFHTYVLCMPKRMYVQESGQLRELAVIDVTSEQFRHGPEGPEWNGSPIQLVENSPDEILETVRLALDLVSNQSLLEERMELVRPLWQEFSRRIPGSNLYVGRTRSPEMAIPDSVIKRFLTTESS